MLFNSFSFLVFLPIVFCLYWFVFNRSLRWQNALVLVASYVFYAWWSWQFLCLLMFSTLLDYAYGFGVASDNKRRSKLFLWLGILNNLGFLALFKYYNFFAVQFQHGLGTLGFHVSPVLLHIALPIGISFYTFHGMSYVFDIYRGLRKPVTSFIDYAVFVSFFPLLVAGPIERANHLLPQIQQKRTFSYSQAIDGCQLMIWGMFKKVVIADSLSVIVDAIFNDYTQHSAFTLIYGAVLFSFQIYGDFSGYSDIALGTARLFGFELLSNFKFPYFSRDLAEFWRRWHISLSSWFRDYLYIPLGGSKAGKWKAVRNTFIIFIVSGFWHGASWTFIAWGTLHACGFIPLLIAGKNRKNTSGVVAQERKLPGIKDMLQMLATFSFVTFAWIFFRSGSITSAIGYIKRIAANSFNSPGQYAHEPYGFTAIGYVIVLLVLDWHFRRNERKYPISKPLMFTLLTVVFLFLAAGYGKNVTFIYFQF